VQLRFKSNLSGEEYVKQKAWRNASLTGGPLHSQGGCGFARQGRYERCSPPGTRIARWYCPTGHCTFSLLPDCLSAHLLGTLAEVEAVVTTVEQANSLEAACDELRRDIEMILVPDESPLPASMQAIARCPALGAAAGSGRPRRTIYAQRRDARLLCRVRDNAPCLCRTYWR